MVREAIDSAVAEGLKVAEREKPKMAAIIPWIEEILEADQKAPRKQRHTHVRRESRDKVPEPHSNNTRHNSATTKKDYSCILLMLNEIFW